MVCNPMNSLTKGRGLTYEEIIQKDIFDPFQMTHSFFIPSITQEEFIVVANDTPADTTGIDKDLRIWNP
jgi:CubicO group peptidase (beta-lactamase class C family)